MGPRQNRAATARAGLLRQADGDGKPFLGLSQPNPDTGMASCRARIAGTAASLGYSNLLADIAANRTMAMLVANIAVRKATNL